MVFSLHPSTRFAALEHAFFNKTVSPIDAAEAVEEESNDLALLDMFLAAKRVEGCSEKTIRYYKTTLTKMLTALDHQIVHITTDDLRNYLALYQQETECSKSNIDNIRRILSSFFSWLEDENYVLKSPVRRIHKIRTTKPVKETYTDEALEIMRDSCENLRDLAIIDLLASTGMRVGEMVNLNIVDVDFENRECSQHGNIMQTMMSRAQSAVCHPPAYSQYLYIILTVSQIDLYLFQTTRHIKASRTTDKNFLSTMCQTG